MQFDDWDNMIKDVKLIKGINISDNQQKYLCQILDENLKNSGGFSFFIHETRHIVYQVDLEEVKNIGDCALISAGFFPERMFRYGFDKKDLMDLSQLAYFRLSCEINAKSQCRIYGELSRNINFLADILWYIKKIDHNS